MEIWVRIGFDETFGWFNVTPVCEKAKLLASLTATKKLSPQTLKTIEALGYKVKIESGGDGNGEKFLRTYIDHGAIVVKKVRFE